MSHFPFHRKLSQPALRSCAAVLTANSFNDYLDDKIRVNSEIRQW